MLTRPEENVSAPFIHPTAVVEKGAKVGNFTKVWFFAHVAPGAVIGENCSLGQNTYVEWNAIVGNACRLGNSVSIYSHVELEDFVFCAPYMVFTHISFPRAAVNRHAVFKKTLVRTGTTLGANSTVVPDVTCGVGTFLAAGSTLTKSSRDWSLMGDHLAVVGQSARADQFDRATKLGHGAQGRRHLAAQRLARRGAFGAQRHDIGFVLARGDEAETPERGMALADLGDLLGAHEHALDLGGLVGAAHPAFDAHIGAPARAFSWQRRGEIAERKPDPGMVRIERGHHDLADVARRYRLAGAGPDDFEDEVLVDHHAFARRCFERNHAEIGSAERLIGLDAARFDLALER